MGRQNFGFYHLFLTLGRFLIVFPLRSWRLQDRTLERQFSLSWGCLICFLFGKIRRYRAVIREKAGFFRCELKKWKINLSNIVIYDGFMMKPWENRRQKSIVAMSIMNHEQEQRPKYITMIIRFSDGGFHDTNFTCWVDAVHREITWGCFYTEQATRDLQLSRMQETLSRVEVYGSVRWRKSGKQLERFRH